MVDVKLHSGQRVVFDDPKRFRVVVSGRRFGKSRLGIWELILRSQQFSGALDPISPQTVIGAMPTLKQAKKVLWQPLVNLCETTELKGLVADINRSDFKITWNNGKPPIVIAGANDSDGDRLRGLRIYFLLADEMQDWKPGILDAVIMPAMADTEGSRALFTGTPKGRLNHFYELFERSKSTPEAYSAYNLPTWTNPTIPREEIELARRTLPPRLFSQEYEASFLDFPGKIFYELSKENLIPGDTPVLSNRNSTKVHTRVKLSDPLAYSLVVMGVDFGDVNPAFSVLGRIGETWYFLEGWQANRLMPPDQRTPVAQPVQDQELLRLARKWGVERVYCDPSRPSSILGIRALDHPGLKRAVAGYNRVEEGIQQVHSLIYQRKLMYVTGLSKDPSAALGGYVGGQDAYLEAESYRRKTDDQGHVIPDSVEEGQEDHICDSKRYALATSKGLLAK